LNIEQRTETPDYLKGKGMRGKGIIQTALPRPIRRLAIGETAGWQPALQVGTFNIRESIKLIPGAQRVRNPRAP
jgi:hypothetical protein